MQPREKLLAALVAAMALAYGGNWLFQNALSAPLEQRRNLIARLKDDIQKKQLQLARARKAGKQLAAWREQSLPSRVPVARTLYQGWLVDLIGRYGFQKPNVDSGEVVNKRGIYQKLPFTVRGQAPLENVVDFLFAFYRSGQLHQIQRLNLTPVGQGQLDVSIAIEALVLPGATHSDALSDQISDRLAYTERAAYDIIVQRDLFARWGTGHLAPADYTYLTAILDVDGQDEAWLTLRTTGEVLKLRAGDPINIGRIRGRIVSIDSPDVVLATDDQQWLLTLGESLSQATPLPPEQ